MATEIGPIIEVRALCILNAQYQVI